MEDEFTTVDYEWWDTKKAFHIIPRPPILIGIQEAYQISESRKVSLHKATEDMRTPELANMRLKQVYDGALVKMLEGMGYPTDDLESIGWLDLMLEADVIAVEWVDRAEQQVPDMRIDVELVASSSDRRHISFRGYGAAACAIIDQVTAGQADVS